MNAGRRRVVHLYVPILTAVIGHSRPLGPRSWNESGGCAAEKATDPMCNMITPCHRGCGDDGLFTMSTVTGSVPVDE